MIVFALMFGAVIAFIYSMTYTYLETQVRFFAARWRVRDLSQGRRDRPRASAVQNLLKQNNRVFTYSMSKPKSYFSTRRTDIESTDNKFP